LCGKLLAGKENYFLTSLKPHYNISKNASSSMLNRKHTGVTRLKISLQARVKRE